MCAKREAFSGEIVDLATFRNQQRWLSPCISRDSIHDLGSSIVAIISASRTLFRDALAKLGAFMSAVEIFEASDMLTFHPDYDLHNDK